MRKHNKHKIAKLIKCAIVINANWVWHFCCLSFAPLSHTDINATAKNVKIQLPKQYAAPKAAPQRPIHRHQNIN